MCGCLSSAPYWGPGRQPRHVPSLGVEPATLSLQAGVQSAEPQQPVLFFFTMTMKSISLFICLVNSFCVPDIVHEF